MYKYEKLKHQGRDIVGKNQFNDSTLKMDVDLEEIVIDSFSASNLPIRIVSEEHGRVDLVSEPSYILFLDGLDGSGVYKKFPDDGRFGTMFSIYNNLDPKYDDYLFAGMIEYNTGNIYFCMKGKGCFLLNKLSKKKLGIEEQKDFGRTSLIYVDEAFSINVKTFSSQLKNYNVQYLRSSMPYYADFIQNKCVYVLECTRKGNLEIATAYAFVKEAGGLMMTLDGIELEALKHFEFSSNTSIHIPVVTTSSYKMFDILKSIIGKR